MPAKHKAGTRKARGHRARHTKKSATRKSTMSGGLLGFGKTNYNKLSNEALEAKNKNLFNTQSKYGNKYNTYEGKTGIVPNLMRKYYSHKISSTQNKWNKVGKVIKSRRNNNLKNAFKFTSEAKRAKMESTA
jgi:hypothetical protein